MALKCQPSLMAIIKAKTAIFSRRQTGRIYITVSVLCKFNTFSSVLSPPCVVLSNGRHHSQHSNILRPDFNLEGDMNVFQLSTIFTNCNQRFQCHCSYTHHIYIVIFIAVVYSVYTVCCFPDGRHQNQHSNII